MYISRLISKILKELDRKGLLLNLKILISEGTFLWLFHFESAISFADFVFYNRDLIIILSVQSTFS